VCVRVVALSLSLYSFFASTEALLFKMTRKRSLVPSPSSWLMLLLSILLSTSSTKTAVAAAATSCCRSSFVRPPSPQRQREREQQQRRRRHHVVVTTNAFALRAEAPGSGGDTTTTTISTYDDDDAAISKGIVSSLTDLVNSIVPARGETNDATASSSSSRQFSASRPPRSPAELLDRIRGDYDVYNYLWTGNIDVLCFDADCTFRDPTLSFVGTDQFVTNIRNIRPIVDWLTQEGEGIEEEKENARDQEDGTTAAATTSSARNRCRSDLLDLQLHADEGYVQSRWNMVGTLRALPWKPKIDVVGRTKFWYRPCTDNGESGTDDSVSDDDSDAPCYKVYRYDEEWEIPAYRALLQLVTPAGTIPNQ